MFEIKKKNLITGILGKLTDDFRQMTSVKRKEKSIHLSQDGKHSNPLYRLFSLCLQNGGKDVWDYNANSMRHSP